MKINMKPHALIIIATLALSLLYGCKREAVKPASPQSLLGKWSLVKDSSTYPTMTPVLGVKVYVGTGEDYFDFRANGNVYIKENGSYDTMTYKMSTATAVVFGKSGGYEVSPSGVWMAVPTPPNAIDPFTEHGARITYSFYLHPGIGGTSRTLYLKK